MILEDILEENTLYSFYGVFSNEFKLGSIVFEALEDPNDGYRSYLDSVPMIKSSSTFSSKPLVNVYYCASEDLIYLKDETGHTWLTIGTDHSDNYYPFFIFDYTPRTDLVDFSIELHNLDSLDPKSLHIEKLI